MNFFRKLAAFSLSSLLLANVQTADARHSADAAGATVVRERGAGQASIRDRIAGILGNQQKEEPGTHLRTSHTMHRWDVESYDTGGTLLFSDSPEYVKESGILYRDTVTGDARVLYYHLNDTHTSKKVAVVLETEADLAVVSVTRGAASTPSTDYLRVGKATQIGYFDPHEMNARIHVTRETPRLLAPAMDTTILHPGELVYGVYDFHASAPVRVSIIMYGADLNPFTFLRTARILPRDSIALRGTFQGMNRIITSRRVYRPVADGIVYFPIGDNIHDTYLSGVDATDGTRVVNYGNYGVLYQIRIPTMGRERTRYFLSPLGGVYAGAVRMQSGQNMRLIETPSTRGYFGDQTLPESVDAAHARTEGLMLLTQNTELADLGVYPDYPPVTFEYSPPGASNLPVNIILMPER